MLIFKRKLFILIIPFPDISKPPDLQKKTLKIMSFVWKIVCKYFYTKLYKENGISYVKFYEKHEKIWNFLHIVINFSDAITLTGVFKKKNLFFTIFLLN